MARVGLIGASLVGLMSVGAAMAQTTGKVDFVTDVQPILRANCVGCHGPAKQNGGLRLDQRGSAMKQLARRIVPGSSANSFVYHRLIGDEFGPQMPPTGELKADQIAVIKAWIDEGAPWPDALANDVALPPLDPKAVALVETLRLGQSEKFLKALTAEPKLLNARGPEGSTPFMYAVLYTSAPMLEKLMKLGANVNAANDAKATALMWGARDLEKTRVLVAGGADVNAKSEDLRTPLMIAARKPGGEPIVRLLLEKGAKVNPNAHAEQQGSPLLEAVIAGEAGTAELLMQHGADAEAIGETGLSMAVQADCDKCLDMLAAKITDRHVFTAALEDVAAYGDMHAVKLMLEKGADAKGSDGLGRTALMYAAESDLLLTDEVKLLIAKGADVNAKDKHGKGGDTGWTALDMAKQHGDTPVVAVLEQAGAKSGGWAAVALTPSEKGELRNAVMTPMDIKGLVQESLPLLQKTDVSFAAQSGCMSCHNNSLTEMTLGAARAHGLKVDEAMSAKQVKVNMDYLEKSRDLLHQGFLFPNFDNFGENVIGYMLLGVNAEHAKANLDTDAAAMYMLSRQRVDGSWYEPKADTRQPLCLDYVANTVLAMRSLQLYAPKVDEAAYKSAVEKAGRWIAGVQSNNNDDRGWRVIGLAWAGGNKPALDRAMKELLASQKADGGWSDLPSMDSTAYATGKSLVALATAGLKTSDPAYQRGVQWLLKNRLADGTWFVPTRALSFQPAFDAGFPHGANQFISAAGTNWADLALLMDLPAEGTRRRVVAEGKTVTGMGAGLGRE